MSATFSWNTLLLISNVPLNGPDLVVHPERVCVCGVQVCVCLSVILYSGHIFITDTSVQCGVCAHNHLHIMHCHMQSQGIAENCN